ncbi:MAG: endonuclease [Bacteroidetes bacterium]|nr:endonuclease [Bacteroidota bacterium]
MKKRVLFIIINILLFSSIIFAQEPTGYYDDADGKTGADLKTALYGIISGHTSLSYSGLWTAYYNTDAKPNGKVWDMYSDVPGGTPPYEYTFGSGQCGTYKVEGDCYNREHSFPKSWFNKESPMVTDIFHIYPTDGKVNGQRSNWPFGEVSSPKWTSQNGCKLGPCSFSGYSGTVFEPIDEYKGDFARTYFYMATRYENRISGWSSAMLDGSSYPAYKEWAINLLLKWDAQDPVSQKEINRNNKIYNDYQHNRNPFIDHPEFVNSVWGENSTPSISNVIISPEIPKSNDEVTISANITDNGTISSAKISWCTDGSSYDNDITMTVSSGNTYQSSTKIPAQENGTTVSYKIFATDDESNTSTTSSRSYIIENNPTLTILSEDFNTGDLGVFSQYSVIGADQIWHPIEYQGTMYVKMSNFDGTTSNANEDWLISPSLNLKNYQNIFFAFKTSMKEYGTDNTFDVYISSDYDGTSDPSSTSFSWTSLTTNCTFSSGDYVWTPSGNVDISAFNKTAVYVAFKYTSGSNDGKTWQIEDVMVTGKEKTNEGFPEIFNINILPKMPTPNDAVDVFADITDDGSISTAKVLWCTDGTSFDNNINMSVSTENTYKSDSKIPAQAEGITVYYKIEATDNEGNKQTGTSLNYLIPSISIPNISNISTTPEQPIVDDDVDVFADITDDGSISTAKVLWCTDGTSFDNIINMSVSTENTYKSDSKIPAQAEGITVYYKVEAVDNENNKVTSNSKSYTNNILAPIIIGEEKICEGDSSLLSLNDGSYDSYNWMMEGNSQILGTKATFYASKQGNYYVEVFKNENSSTSSYFTLTLNNLPISNFSYVINGKTVSFTDKSSYGTSFLWNFNDGFTNQSKNPIHSFSSYENYKVVYTVTNICGSTSSSQDILLKGNSINSIDENHNINIYPNPANNILTLSTDSNNESVEIYNIIGEKVLSFYKQNSTLQININNLKKGMYFIKICDNKLGIKTSSFIKN